MDASRLGVKRKWTMRTGREARLRIVDVVADDDGLRWSCVAARIAGVAVADMEKNAIARRGRIWRG